MPRNPARVVDTRAWPAKALVDLRAAEHRLWAVPPLLEGVVFHSQRTAEKVLKGFPARHDEAFGKRQNLGELGRQTVAFDPALALPLALPRYANARARGTIQATAQGLAFGSIGGAGHGSPYNAT